MHCQCSPPATAPAQSAGAGLHRALASVDLNLSSNLPPRQIGYRRRNRDDDKRDAEAAEIGRCARRARR